MHVRQANAFLCLGMCFISGSTVLASPIDHVIRLKMNEIIKTGHNPHTIQTNTAKIKLVDLLFPRQVFGKVLNIIRMPNYRHRMKQEH